MLGYSLIESNLFCFLNISKYFLILLEAACIVLKTILVNDCINFHQED